MLKQLPEGPYNPQDTEPRILADWLKQKLYKPETAKQILEKQGRYNPKEKFSLVNPPPNAYARPHIGNVSGYSYQDVFGRRARMQGKQTILFPGKDHAAQQAEIVYIRDVLSKQGKSKSDFSREEFYKNAYEYFTGIMKIAQTDEQRIGLSADFDRDMFTLDPRAEATVMRTFAKLWKDNMVYKGVRIVNWSPGLQSAVADIDTERQTVPSFMYYLKYAIPGTAGEVEEFFQKHQAAESIELDSSDLILEQKSGKVFLGHAGNIDVWYIAGEEQKQITPTSIVVPFTGKLALARIEEKQAITVFQQINKKYGASFTLEFTQDIPVEYKDMFFSRGYILGTVRPETKFGDTALAVNPKDERYRDLIGQDVELIGATGPVMVKIIADPAIDVEFGTGVMKVTPAHSPTDYEIYLRHNQLNPDNQIGYKNVIEKDCRLNHLAGEFAGMHAEEDRGKLVEIFTHRGIVVHTEASESNITVCERTKTIIQPLMSSQWFADTDKLKVPALESVEKGEIHIHPDYMTNKLKIWLQNLRDWPISRSIWWGYRIPVWYKGAITESTDQSGQIRVSIGGKEAGSMQQAISAGLLKLVLPEGFNPVLIPGRYAPENSTYYAQIKKKFPWAQIVHTGSKDQDYADYNQALSKVSLENNVVVAHSLGAAAIIDYLIETKIGVAHLVLLAPSNESSPRFKEYVDRGFWKSIDRLGELKQYADKITLIYSDDDDMIDPTSFAPLAEKLGATVILEQGRKHFATGKYVLESIELSKILEVESRDYEQKRQAETAKLISEGWIQDEDVFDTWFSSGQWPYATLESEGLMEYYPTGVMETGFDILELWVSRMIMLGLYTQGDIPFRDVYLHGLIKAEDGQKMSKSKGNIVYTEDIINEYGADTLRMLYIVGNKAGASYRVDNVKLKGYRNFLNKIWNATRFVLNNLGNFEAELPEIVEAFRQIPDISIPDEVKDLTEYKGVSKQDMATEFANFQPQDGWQGVDFSMLKSLLQIITTTNDHMDNFRIGLAAEELYQHFWHTFADIYIEQVKTRLFTKDREGNVINSDAASIVSRQKALAVLLYALQTYLKLLHPYIPFVTENIWQHLPEETRESETIMYAVWPS